MTPFERYRYLLRNQYHENHSFKVWFIQLKRCYQWSDWAIAELLHSDCRQVWRWRYGKERPRKMVIRFIGYLILWRIGAAREGRDLLRVGKLMATGELERMVDKFLAEEAQAIAKQKAASEARKRAKSVPQRDNPPAEPTK